MKIKRKLNEVDGGQGSMADNSCPEIFELESGDFAIIGSDITDDFRGELQSTGKGVIAVDEKVVRIPRVILTSAKDNIPKS